MARWSGRWWWRRSTYVSTGRVSRSWWCTGRCTWQGWTTGKTSGGARWRRHRRPCCGELVSGGGAKEIMKPVKPGKGQQGMARSFNHAYQGLVYAVRTQRNMRFHVATSAVVLVLSLLVGVSKLELAILILVITAVFVTEML